MSGDDDSPDSLVSAAGAWSLEGSLALAGRTLGTAQVPQLSQNLHYCTLVALGVGKFTQKCIKAPFHASLQVQLGGKWERPKWSWRDTIQRHLSYLFAHCSAVQWD